tara:strand:+ start:425 stop:613 length:189 start_codon:yes stop_codon:yes gene_type:complete
MNAIINKDPVPLEEPPIAIDDNSAVFLSATNRLAVVSALVTHLVCSIILGYEFYPKGLVKQI